MEILNLQNATIVFQKRRNDEMIKSKTLEIKDRR